MPNPETNWNHGDVVRDREDDDPDPAIVVNTPGAPADEWDISRLDKTVAEDNPEYPSDAEIITVVFEENLNEAFPNWEANNPITYATLEERNIQYYSFPDPRLEPAKPTDTTKATNSESSPDLEEETDDTRRTTRPRRPRQPTRRALQTLPMPALQRPPRTIPATPPPLCARSDAASTTVA